MTEQRLKRSRGLNKHTCIGNAIADSITRRTNSGRSVTNFRLAANEDYYDSDGNIVNRTEFINFVAFGKYDENGNETGLAAVAKNWIKRGKQVYVKGRLQTRRYTDKHGVERFPTEVVAEDIILLQSPKTAREQATEPADMQPAVEPPPYPIDDGMPF